MLHNLHVFQQIARMTVVMIHPSTTAAPPPSRNDLQFKVSLNLSKIYTLLLVAKVFLLSSCSGPNFKKN
jgi:hypothetical protein